MYTDLQYVNSIRIFDLLSTLLNGYTLHRIIKILLLIVMFTQSSLEVASAQSRQSSAGYGPIAFIKESNGRDAIFVRDGAGENSIFRCGADNQIILTPSVSADGKFIAFLVDSGRNQKTIHIVGPMDRINGEWQGEDLILNTIRGGAWPVVNDRQSVYISMADQTSLKLEASTHIYLISPDEIRQISFSGDSTSHIWPVINPQGDKLIYRSLPITDDEGLTNQQVKSVLLDLKTGVEQDLFVDQLIYTEQWSEDGGILYSIKDQAHKGNRIYSLLNPENNQKREIYENKSRQGSLSRNSQFLATIRRYPEGGANFDIFIADLVSGLEINLTQSLKQSESLIGWIE